MSKGIKVILLPGMDGTGDLFGEFVARFPDWIEPRIVSYPSDLKLSYEQLLPIVRSTFPSDEPFVLLAESFSTPLAVSIVAEAPTHLQALVICAGFVSPPCNDFLAAIARILAPASFSFGMPEKFCRKFLVGEKGSSKLVESVRSAVSRVSPGVLAHRLRSVLGCNSRQDLSSISVPLLCITGTEDRLVKENCFIEIESIKPETRRVRIRAPHLILQSSPDESVSALVSFLREV